MIEIVGFEHWHRGAIYDIVRKRTTPAASHTVRLEYVSQYTAPDAPHALGDRWTAFVERVGARAADVWWARTCAAAATSGVPGVIRDDRESFGPRTLWRAGDPVTAADGAAVYDALLESGLARSVDRVGDTAGARLVAEFVRAEAARRAAAPAAAPTARRAVRRAARPTAGKAADKAADTPAGPAAGPASPTGGLSGRPVVVVVAGERQDPPLPSAGAEGGGEVAAPTEAAAPAASAEPPLTAGEVAVASVLRLAIGNARLKLETPEDRAERLRAAEHAVHGHPDDRPAAKRRLDELVAAERARQDAAIAVLGGRDAGAARALIRQLEHLDPVAIRCATARKAARADERDQRRDARAALPARSSTGIERTLRELRRVGHAGGDLGQEAWRLVQAPVRDLAWEQAVRGVLDRAAGHVAEPAGSEV